MSEIADTSVLALKVHKRSLAWIKVYYELTKPERTLANVITAAAGFLLAERWHVDFSLFISLLIGLSLLVASACVLNNVLDRHIDTKMPRTKKRALVAGTVSPIAALSFASVLGVLGVVVLVTLVSWLVLVLGLLAYFDYIVLYGWSKRHSVHSTLIGTPAGALPMMAGYVAVVGKIDLTAGLLFLLMIFWQMAHFYAIAIYRLKDYKAGNIPVMSVVYGVVSTRRQLMAYIVAFTLVAICLSIFGPMGILFGVVAGLLGPIWLLRGFTLKTDSTAWAKAMFVLSLNVLLIISVALALGPILP